MKFGAKFEIKFFFVVEIFKDKHMRDLMRATLGQAAFNSLNAMMNRIAEAERIEENGGA